MGTLALPDGKIIMGPRGDAPMRGRLEARSAEDGSQIWQFWAVPAPGEPGGETWPAENDAYLTSGTSFWVTGTYDTETNLLYYGTSNPNPFADPTLRAGDNLYSQATVALNGDTGALVWYFQFTPNDQWDYDENGTNQIIETDSGTRIGHFGRNGFAYILNADTGEFIAANQYVNEVNWTAGIDPKTGMPLEYDPALAAGGIQEYAIGWYNAGDNPAPLVCPNIQGGNNHWPTSYSERTGLMYATAIEACEVMEDPMSPVTGSISSVDADGNVVAKVQIPFSPYGGQLTTAGGLLFTSMLDGTFMAVDDTSLETLWSINLGSPIEAPPITYSVGGKQYVAIAVGGNGYGATFVNYPARAGDPNADSLANMQQTWTLYFFAL
jgi:alcohol dehydrogenase (cytochrome c)